VLHTPTFDESDPLAIVSAQEAPLFAAEQHAGFIERNMGAAPSGGTTSGTSDDEATRIILLEYSRNDWFRRALLESSELGECRQSKVDVGHCPKLPSGAKCFVPPNIFEAVDLLEVFGCFSYPSARLKIGSASLVHHWPANLCAQ